MTKTEVDQCYKLFDKTDKGYFTFTDFTRVSKLVQGFEIDQVFNEDEKLKQRLGGKRCIGFDERFKIEYCQQKTYKEKAKILAV